MAYDKEKVFKEILIQIEEGASLRSVLRQEDMPGRTAFFEWLKEDEVKANQYAKATEKRHDVLFEEILEIAYTPEIGTTTKETERGVEITTGDMVAHRRLKIDSLKWCLSKMNPKKYGDKLDMTSGGEKLPQVTIFQLPDNDR